MARHDRAMSGSQLSPNTPSRRSILSAFPAALLAGWLGLGRRSKAGSASPEHYLDVAAAAKPVPMYCYGFEYSSKLKVIEGEDRTGAEPISTLAVYDERDRLVQYTAFHPSGWTEVHTYYLLDGQA